MDGYWRLEGTDLGDSETEVIVTTTERTVEVSTPTEAVRGDSEVWERTGKSLKMLNITFTILNRGANKFTWDAFIVGILENRTGILLESPEYDENYRILDTYRSVYITPKGRISSRIVNASQIDITFNAILLGAPRTDGGAFEACSGYAVEFLDNDFYAATNSAGYTFAPLLGVPEQSAGYVKARSATTFLMTSLTRKYALIAAGDGVEGIVQLYDLVASSHGSPYAEANGGPAYVCESENQEEEDFDFVNVATAPNDFSITSATAPWLYGIPAGSVGDIEDGPTATEGTAWTITGAGDGTTGTVSILRTTSVDGLFVVEVA